MGSQSAISAHGLEVSMVALLISFFTDVFVNILVLTGSEVDTFLILVLVLFLWIVIRNAMRSLSDAASVTVVSQAPPGWLPPGATGLVGGGGGTVDESEGWSEAWATLMDFISRILVILVFQFAARLILQEWLLAGVTTQETLVLLFLLAVIFFPVYLWIHRTWTAHDRRERQAFYQTMQQARAVAVAAAGFPRPRLRI